MNQNVRNEQSTYEEIFSNNFPRFFCSKLLYKKKDSDDLTQLLLLSALTSNSTQTSCGYIASALTGVKPAGKFEASRTLQTIDTWESLQNGGTIGQGVVVFFRGVTASDRVKFVYSSGSLNDFAPGSSKSTSMNCPYSYANRVEGYDTLGMTRNAAVSDTWIFNASATTPSQFTMYLGRDNFDDLTKTVKVIIESQ
ncbi:hypothetical protein ND861_14830 [Leptospira sp. 2 VSF19]|uniref:Uncharacterized protein n=1 Tax=Leptospira soteropolitanensis TaxID=2950025 RepID=A0AAW5VFI3_9LEPT|nr:hypothetical protein [Leptospira soteropolitanensis]MCW7493878.1 hypothetical protein [Leptospira soteropolitanensis]MCW7501472.1 hypothetical protein [Leptospira soteropolitanensis]MCW7523765.1 hypothetical protein [Leptospira soteropolitanensis]MCW7527629.1 hypothetical protein [Leptospira soteropolitanensis]MCW7531483.1 hypothetical protein [Leptospira soteropolitanensis]